MEFTFEPLSEKNRKAVIDIFNYFVEESFAAYPEHRVDYDFFDVFLKMSEVYPGIAICDDIGATVGFALLRPYHPASTFTRTAEIGYFILPSFTGKGAGTKALHYLVREAEALGVDTIVASISSRNEESIRFHLKNGFTECGRLRRVGRKFGEDFDVVWMQKRIQ
ncbi:MAG: N-acetyltransferase family protein [Candidatus Eremiobacteraeota bacterium]|nr:N-acetyltransferase family protein [Candidatus Eremiobacteraeota bacterium]